MKTQGYTTAFTVDQGPDQVFQAINDVPSWWSGEVQGDTARVGGEFTYRVAGVHYSRQKIAESVPGQRVAWHVTESRLDAADPKDEWTGTDIVFEIARKGAKTEVRFTHRGLVPANDCYDSCSNAWGLLVNRNLFQRIVTGQAQPRPW